MKITKPAVIAFYLALLLTLAVAINGCTQNQRAKSFGGTADVNLPKATKLVGATWKDSHLWYLVRPMRADEQPETSELHEQSSWGIAQGTVVFHESR